MCGDLDNAAFRANLLVADPKWTSWPTGVPVWRKQYGVLRWPEACPVLTTDTGGHHWTSAWPTPEPGSPEVWAVALVRELVGDDTYRGVSDGWRWAESIAEYWAQDCHGGRPNIHFEESIIAEWGYLFPLLARVLWAKSSTYDSAAWHRFKPFGLFALWYPNAHRGGM
jgi:hypothetical protein